MVTLHLLKGDDRMADFERAITEAFMLGKNKVNSLLKLPKVDVVVGIQAESTIPEVGVGGYAPNAHRIDISIDPLYPDLVNTLNEKFQSTLSHELHHCVRWSTCGYGVTLIEAVISEGLADHFDVQVNGKLPPQWSTALSQNQIDEQLLALIQEGKNKNYDHAAWFFGSNPEIVPRWTGYCLGYHIVGRYMAAHGRTASELVAEPADSFMDTLALLTKKAC